MSNTGYSTSTTLAVSRREANAHLAHPRFRHLAEQFQMPRALRLYDLEHKTRYALDQHGAGSMPASWSAVIPHQPFIQRISTSRQNGGRKSRDGNRQRSDARTYRPDHATFVVEDSPDNCKHGEDTQSNDQSIRQLIYRIYTSNPALNLLSLVFRH